MVAKKPVSSAVKELTVEELAKLTPLKAIAHLKSGDLTHYKLFEWDMLEIDPDWNERDRNSQAYKDHIDFLEESIGLNGVREPLKGYFNPATGKIRVFHGHCRYEATGRMWEKGIKIKIPVDVNESYGKISDAERILSMLVDNTGLELDKLEQARAVRRLHNYGWELDAIGLQLKPKHSAQQVQTLLDLDTSTNRVKDLVREGKIRPTTVASSVKRDGADATETYITASVELAEGIGVKPTANFVDNVREMFINEEIKPEDVFSADPTIKNATLTEVAKRTKSKKKKPSAEDILNGKVDMETLVEGVSIERRKQRKQIYDKQASAGLMLRKSLRAIAQKAPCEIVEDKIQVTFLLHEWEELKRLFESDFDEEIKKDEETPEEDKTKFLQVEMFEEQPQEENEDNLQAQSA